MSFKRNITRWLLVLLGGVNWLGGSAQEVEVDFSSVEEPPIPVSVFGGHRVLSYQHVLNRSLHHTRFSFFNITVFDAEYGEEPVNRYLISSLFSYRISKRIAAGIGGEIQRPGAFAIVGLQYSYASESMLLVLYPSVNLNGNTQYSQLNLFEFRPILTKNLRGYLRAQVLVGTNFQTIQRGNQQLWLGLQIHGFQFGLAASFDQFNDNTITTKNYGGFLRMLLF